MRIIDLFASLAIAVLAGLGVGSGGLLVIYLTLVTEAEQLWAQGINLAFFVLATISSLIVNIKKRRINLRILLFIITVGMLGVVTGSALLPYISPEIIRKSFGVMLVALSLFTLFEGKVKKAFEKKEGE